MITERDVRLVKKILPPHLAEHPIHDKIVHWMNSGLSSEEIRENIQNHIDENPHLYKEDNFLCRMKKKIKKLLK